MAERPLSLGIEQDVDCVTWTKLVQLREKYNLLWDKMDYCNASEGDRYGTSPHYEETNDLPTVEGFFRVTMDVAGDVETGFTCTPGAVHFILSGGTLLERLENPNYSYLEGSKKPFHALLKDECNNCSKFHPLTWAYAEQVIPCPFTNNARTLYPGMKALTFTEADDACGDILDWGTDAQIERIRNHAAQFLCEKRRTKPGMTDCDEVMDSCCDSLFDVGHYQSVSKDIDNSELMVLRYVDVFCSAAGTAIMEGNLTALIYADELQDIQDRTINDMTKLILNSSVYCDECGPVHSDACPAPGNNALVCESPLVFDEVARINAISDGECSRCNEGFENTICTCPWEELAGVIDFLVLYSCVYGCGECDCEAISSSSSSGGSSSSSSSSGGSSSSSSGPPTYSYIIEATLDWDGFPYGADFPSTYSHSSADPENVLHRPVNLDLYGYQDLWGTSEVVHHGNMVSADGKMVLLDDAYPASVTTPPFIPVPPEIISAGPYNGPGVFRFWFNQPYSDTGSPPAGESYPPGPQFPCVDELAITQSVVLTNTSFSTSIHVNGIIVPPGGSFAISIPSAGCNNGDLSMPDWMGTPSTYAELTVTTP